MQSMKSSDYQHNCGEMHESQNPDKLSSFILLNTILFTDSCKLSVILDFKRNSCTAFNKI